MSTRILSFIALGAIAFTGLACAQAPIKRTPPAAQQTPQAAPQTPQAAQPAPQVTLGAPQPMLSAKATKAFEKLAASIRKQHMLYESDKKLVKVSMDSKANADNAFNDYSKAHDELGSAIEAACKATGDPAVDFAPAAAALTKVKLAEFEHSRLKKIETANDAEFQKVRSAWWAERDITAECADAFRDAVKETLGKDGDIERLVDLERLKYHEQFISAKLAANKGDAALAQLAAPIAKLRAELEIELNKPAPARSSGGLAKELHTQRIEAILAKPIDAAAAAQLKALRAEASKIFQQQQEETAIRTQTDKQRKAEQEANSKYSKALSEFLLAVE